MSLVLQSLLPYAARLGGLYLLRLVLLVFLGCLFICSLVGSPARSPRPPAPPALVGNRTVVGASHPIDQQANCRGGWELKFGGDVGLRADRTASRLWSYSNNRTINSRRSGPSARALILLLWDLLDDELREPSPISNEFVNVHNLQKGNKNMRTYLVIAAVVAMISAPVVAQPANRDANTPAVNAPNSPPNPGAPVAGANSFTEGQAKSRIEFERLRQRERAAERRSGRMARQGHEGWQERQRHPRFPGKRYRAVSGPVPPHQTNNNPTLRRSP